MVKEMAPKKALAPSQPTARPPQELLAKAKSKVLLVPKLVLLKRQHEEEQQRRMRYLRSGAAEAAEEEAWASWADAYAEEQEFGETEEQEFGEAEEEELYGAEAGGVWAESADEDPIE